MTSSVKAAAPKDARHCPDGVSRYLVWNDEDRLTDSAALAGERVATG